jgi:hypothetical protein
VHRVGKPAAFAKDADVMALNFLVTFYEDTVFVVLRKFYEKLLMFNYIII